DYYCMIWNSNFWVF
nr:immunoglobulin light chain junction region [Macaca mulatta]MOV99467.1 immunoglobulin light chain junction region [Macaca mulatta]